MRKELWEYIYDTESKPKDSDIDALKQWRKSNAKIMSWIISSLETQIGNLRIHDNVVETWNSLKNIYYQDNDA